jgi:hypothetical protein
MVMMKRYVVAALLLAVVPIGLHAAETDNAAGITIPIPDAGSSYFQGVWVGSWPGYADPNKKQDITITIGKKIGNNTYKVIYSWDAVEWRRGITLAGKVKTEGKEQDDKFLFQYENKQGRKFEITLQKHKDNVIKARIEKSGPTAPNERPYNETYLNRK